ncbi:molybdenum cofactor guanylyltransferase MobA [Pseudooceanicola sp. LIPI14-2-Ac024]|uniref:molybdenum cofactor guanylyltransferase MobA n=1 Tax=Pseudooceanicola sp. LIPI14-2-Ac024 TaxID=3344875 RepID=UPI0035CEDCE5
MTEPLGLILAGGQGRRMGGVDKAFVPLAGRPLIAHVADRFLPQVATCAISAAGDPARFTGYGMPVLADGEPGGLGPLAGVLSGLDWAAGQGAAALVTVSVDTPFLPPDLVPRLLLAAEGRDPPLAVAAEPGAEGPRLHPACALWPVSLREGLRATLRGGERRLGRWAEAQGAAVAVFADGGVAFLNVNRPEDLARAEALLAG